MRTIFFHYALESMRQLLEALFYDLKQSAPIFADDSSSSCMTHLTCQLATSTITHRDDVIRPEVYLDESYVNKNHSNDFIWY
jgi:hypothetical protein